jgi:aminocarboxymuconate-semialdehyde decarboxylase
MVTLRFYHPRRIAMNAITPVVDTHSHIVPSEMWKVMLHDGPRYGVEITGNEKRWIVRLEGSSYARPMYMPLTNDAERIATMDVQGVDMQVLAGYVDFSGYTMPVDLGVKFSELQNETIAGVIASNPDRYAGAANVPLQDAKAAIRVMERAARDYGFKAAQIATYLGPSRFLDDPALDPFWEAAQEMEWLLIFHPYDEQPAAGLREYFLHNCIGYPAATTVAVTRMILGGVFTRFPDLMVKVPHGGGFLPAVIERLRHAADFRPEPRAKGFRGDPLDVMKRLYFDTLTFSPAALRYLVDLVGADRLMLGSDYPFEMAETDPVGVTKAGVPEHHHEAVLGGTAARILCLDPACGHHGRPLRPKAEAV